MMIRTLLKAHKAAGDYLRYRQEILEAVEQDPTTAKLHLIDLRAARASVRRAQARLDRIERGMLRRDDNRMAARRVLDEVCAHHVIKINSGMDLTDYEARINCLAEEVLAGGSY